MGCHDCSGCEQGGNVPTGRIGTIHYDEATGEYVMPADFAGDEELRWRGEPPVSQTGNGPAIGNMTDAGQPAGHPPGHEAEKSLHARPNEVDTGKDTITNTIPLAEQERCYEAYWMREVVRLEKRLKDSAYLQHVHDLGLARLRQGFKTYGDSMYQWPTHRRDAEMDEELADFLVYGSSEGE